MKRYLPLLLFLGGLLVLAGVYFFVLRKPAEENSGTEEETLEVSLVDRPIASLTPKEDGHWLKLRIEKLLAGADSLDYELLYTLPDGRTQGVPGTITLTGKSVIERDLLLGSESSGKFRYDEGVETGTLTLRFRNDKGKLLARFSTKFHLQSATKDLSSVEGKFVATLSKSSNDYFVVMETFGIPDNPPVPVTSGPYGLFSSAKGSLPSVVKIGSEKVYRHITGPRWKVHEDNDDLLDSDSGVFIGSSQ
ncbi:MAG: hypothetical protein AAB875_05430 [Patescibacteria group bacterium]